MYLFTLIVLVSFYSGVNAQHDPNYDGDRTTMVHLFEWRWEDIALECERFLGPYGYGGVQVSPPNENRIIMDPLRPWYERYQSVSYNLNTRSGNEAEFQSMVRRCNNAGVRIYVDAIVNHMCGDGEGMGTGGCYFNDTNNQYNCVEYSALDFNVALGRCPSESGGIDNDQDVNQVRNCKLLGLNDLYAGGDYVRYKLVEYLNRLISYGVAGFRIDAATHMWPEDLRAITSRLNTLQTDHGFSPGAKAFIYQEVIDFDDGPVHAADYTDYGRVTEFKYSYNIGTVFRKQNGQRLSYLTNFGEGWAFQPSGNAFVFVDNHDNQRAGSESILTYKDGKLYKMAQAFTLAWPYGAARVMSSFFFDKFEDSPPMDDSQNLLPVPINPDMSCGNGRVCEHRWRAVYNMAKFRNVVQGENVTSWWDNFQVSNGNQIAFGRGDKGFIMLNNEEFDFSGTLQTSLPPGEYCDVINGSLENGSCTGKSFIVNADSTVNLLVPNSDDVPVVALHIDEKCVPLNSSVLKNPTMYNLLMKTIIKGLVFCSHFSPIRTTISNTLNCIRPDFRLVLSEFDNKVRKTC